MNILTPEELHRRLEKGEKFSLLDVRDEWEHALVHLDGDLHIPLGSLPARWGELDSGERWVVYCHHGYRSARACQYLQSMGIAEVYNLEGGIDRWSRTVEPSLSTY